jgi:hypothetical protein
MTRLDRAPRSSAAWVLAGEGSMVSDTIRMGFASADDARRSRATT